MDDHSTGFLTKSAAVDQNSKLLSKQEILKRDAMRVIFKNFKEENVESYQRETHKTREIRKKRKAIKINDTIAALLAVFGLIISSFEYELYYTGNPINLDNLNATQYSGELTDDQSGQIIMNK